MLFNGAPQSTLCTNFHHKHQGNKCLARNPNKHIWYDLVKTKKKGVAQCAMVQTTGFGPVTTRLSVVYSTNWATLAYMVLFICPRKHPARVCKFYLYPTCQKVLALRLIELTWSIYIPYPASGRHSVQLLRTSLHLFMYLWINADLRLTNCLIFAHIRPVRRHGLSIE